MKRSVYGYNILLAINVLIFQYVGYRVNQVYDIDNKTYLIKLQQPDKKVRVSSSKVVGKVLHALFLGGAVGGVWPTPAHHRV